jgi:hypothetical protein
VIVAFGADKGRPGVTTAALVCGMVWPTERVVLEADPAGADLPFRLTSAAGTALDPSLSVRELANAVRTGATDAVTRHAQATMLGVPVVPGAMGPEMFSGTLNLWPRIAATSAAWPGTVLTDLGRLHPGHGALPMAKLATVTVLLARPDRGGMYRMRARAAELVSTLGEPSRTRGPLVVAIVCRSKDSKRALADAREVLNAARLPVPVAGYLADDPDTVEALYRGEVTTRVVNSDLIASARTLAQTLIGWWPELASAPPTSGHADAGQAPVPRSQGVSA